jgi:head-tail adaptor
MDKLVTLKEKITTTDSYGEPIETWIALVKVGSEKATGTLTKGVIYQITKTQTNHFGTGLVVYDVFTATAETTCDVNNTVKPVTLTNQVWAERRELKGDEKWAAQQVIGSIACKYRIRYRDDVGPLDMLIDAAGTEYDIQSAIEIGRCEGLELTVMARSE